VVADRGLLSVNNTKAEVEGWLADEPTTTANEPMDRLAPAVPDASASKAQLRTLQRRIKAWRAETAKDLILGKLKNAAVQVEPESCPMRCIGPGRPGRFAPRGYGHVDEAPLAHRRDYLGRGAARLALFTETCLHICVCATFMLRTVEQWVSGQVGCA
jgi:hypothetical protein